MKKLPASSLLEVLVAGVLLCIIVSISFVTFINVTASAPSFRRHQLDILLQSRINDLCKKTLMSWERTDSVSAEATLVETVTQFQNNKVLFVIDLKVIDVHGRIEAQTAALHYQYDEQVR